MFEAIVYQGTTEDAGVTTASYEPFLNDVGEFEIDVTIMFKPQNKSVYGPHILVMGFADSDNYMVSFRHRQGLDLNDHNLNICHYRTHNY